MIMTVQVDVLRDCTEETIPHDAAIKEWIVSAVAAASNITRAEVAVRIVDAADSRRLNRDYRDRDKPTNVLSFPAGTVAGMPATEPLPLGDIVVCAEVVAAEALQYDVPVADRWGHMLVHGTLHLLGFDHIEKDDAAAMELLETRILTARGVTDPYGEQVQNC
jgi:probable rRNA maturation factor